MISIDAIFEDETEPEDIPEDASLETRATVALAYITQYGQIDGNHYKMWVLDQIVRILLGNKYNEFIDKFCTGEDGPETYSWDEGVAP